MTWVEGQVVAPTADEQEAEATGGSSSESADSDKKDNPGGVWERARKRDAAEGELIDKVDEGIDGNQLMVLFVYTASEERKFARTTEASKKFESEVLGSFQVATALQGTRNVRLNGEELSRDVKKTYGISSGAPQVILIDPSGKVLYKAKLGTDANTLAKMIESAKEHVEKLVAKRDGQ